MKKAHRKHIALIKGFVASTLCSATVIGQGLSSPSSPGDSRFFPPTSVAPGQPISQTYAQMAGQSVSQIYAEIASPSVNKEEKHPILDKPIPFFSQDDQPIQKVLQALGRTYGISIIADRDVEGNVYFEFHNATLRTILDGVCEPDGYFWELEKSGWISVKRTRTIIYHIEYPRLERTGSATSEINLGSTGYSNNNGGSGSGGGGRSSGGGGGSGGNSENEDKASVKLEQKNDETFWDKLAAEVKQILTDTKSEKIVFNRFSGTIQLTGNRRTHQYMTEYLQSINVRIGMQVEVIGKIVEVSLDNQDQFGIDWRVAQFHFGSRGQGGQPVVDPGGTGGTVEDIVAGLVPAGSGMFQFDSDTLTGTVGWGDVSAVIHALSQQGDVKVVSSPRIVTANNQTAYIKDSVDTPYFQLDNNSTYYNDNSSGQTKEQYQQYTINTISIGTIMAVTPQVANNGDITLDVMPALTRWKEDKQSKDGYSEAPVLEVKQMSTIVRLKSGETAIIGGLVTDTDGSIVRKIPLLGDIPFIGKWLFTSTGEVKRKSELVIFLTPRIITPGSVMYQANREDQAQYNAAGYYTEHYQQADSHNVFSEPNQRRNPFGDDSGNASVQNYNGVEVQRSVEPGFEENTNVVSGPPVESVNLLN